MINGFEELTKPLTDEEFKAMEIIVPILKRAIGDTAAIPNRKLSFILRSQHRIHMDGVRIRKIINYIRIKGLIPHLLSSSGGYFVSHDEQQIKRYIRSLQQREAAIAAVRNAIEKQKVNEVQGGLFQ